MQLVFKSPQCYVCRIHKIYTMGRREDKCLCTLSNLACWAIVLFVSYSWVILLICKSYNTGKFLMNDKPGKKSLRGNDCSYFLHSVR